MGCKGICGRYRGAPRYAQGSKRCQICDMFVKWSGGWCPCCGYRLRAKPRNKRYKEMERERIIRENNEKTAKKEDYLKIVNGSFIL